MNFLLFASLGALVVAGGEVLFAGRTTAVTELTGTSFSHLVNTTGSGSWVVVHYAHWCGHCVSFAPQFIALAETYGTPVRFGAVDCASPVKVDGEVSNNDLCNLNDVKSYPTIILFKDGQRVKNLPIEHGELEVELGQLTQVKVVKAVRAGKSTPQAFSGGPHAFSSQSVLEDATLALGLILEREVFRGSTTHLDPSEIDDLRRLLVICKSLNVGIRKGCGQVLDVLLTTDTLTKAQYVSVIGKYIGEVKADSFATCKDFSCGMWRLLHLISLSSFAPHSELMNSIRFVVDKYLSCGVCRDHFLAHFDKCEFDRCANPPDQISLPLWLWRVHNGVSLRLGKPEWPTNRGNREVVNELRSMYGMDPIPGSEEFFQYGTLLLILSLASLAAFILYRVVDARVALSRLHSQVNKKYLPII